MYKNVFYKGSARVPNLVRPPGGMAARSCLHAKAGFSCQLSKGQGTIREVAHSELAGHQNKGNFFVMIATRKCRYVYDKENELPCELFDLEKDPDEFHNLVDEPGSAGCSGIRSLRVASLLR